MDVKLEKWFRPNIDKEVLKELTKKSDIKGLIHVSIYFSLLSIVGYLAYLTWGTWWSVLWFYIYGNIFCFCNPIWHETGHKTAFKTKFLNEIFYTSHVSWHTLSLQDGDLHILFTMEILTLQKILMIMKLNMTII